MSVREPPGLTSAMFAASDQQQGERGGVAEAAGAVLVCGHGFLGDLETVREHVDKQKDEDADRKHGEPHACA